GAGANERVPRTPPSPHAGEGRGEGYTATSPARSDADPRVALTLLPIPPPQGGRGTFAARSAAQLGPLDGSGKAVARSRATAGQHGVFRWPLPIRRQFPIFFFGASVYQ